MKYGKIGKNIGKGEKEAPDEAGGSAEWQWLEKHPKWFILESKCWAGAAHNAHLLFQSGYSWKQDPVSCLAVPNRQTRSCQGAFGASFWVVVNCWASFCMSSAMRKRKVQTSSGRSGTVCLDPWSPCIPRGLLAVLCVLPLHLSFVAQLPWGQDALHICSLSQKSMTWASYQPVLMLWASSIFTAPQGILWFV